MKKKVYKMICNVCGKTAPIDTERSSENWTVYLSTCSCGGACTLKEVSARDTH